MRKEPDFEQAMEELSRAVTQMQQKGLSLNEMTNLYKTGVEAAKECLSILKNTEHEIEDISMEIERIIQEEESRNNDRECNKK